MTETLSISSVRIGRVDIPWQWRVALRKTSNWNGLEVGEDNEAPFIVRVHNRIPFIESDTGDLARFIDPADAVDHILVRHRGRIQLDGKVFVAPEEAAGWGFSTRCAKSLARTRPDVLKR